MDLLITRELFAQDADKMGFHVSDEEIEDRIAQGRILAAGQPRNITRDYQYQFAALYKDGFDYDKWRTSFCTYFLRTTPKKFIEEQRHELLAEKVEDLIRVATRVSPEEVKRAYIDHETQAKLEFVRFAARRFEDDLVLAPADIDAFLKENQAKVKEQYDQRAFLYKAGPKEAQVRVRAIFVATAKDAPKDDAAKAEAKIRDAAKKIKGGADFAQVARDVSEDERTKKRGGDLGWKRKGSAGLGPEFDDKVFALKKGETSDVIKTDRGFYLARAEDVREGDLPLDAVSRDLAEDLMRKERGAAKAKAEAADAVAKVKAGTAIETLFPKEDKDASAKPPTKVKGLVKSDTSPRLQETGYFARKGNVLEDIGTTKDGTKAVFGNLKKGDVGGPYEVQGGVPSYVVVRLVDRKDPDMAAFETKHDEFTHEASVLKAQTVLLDLMHQRCVEARDSGKIAVNGEMLSYGGPDNGVPYAPCTMLGMH
jgi:peptidyl-prolyl cis-trans isomerase D